MYLATTEYIAMGTKTTNKPIEVSVRKVKRKPSIKQRKALENMVGNGGNVTKAMRDAGYAEATLNTPQKLTESAGFLELCEEHGLTDSLLVDALVEDIQKKKGRRVKELELGFKVKRKFAEVQNPGNGVILNIVSFNK